MTATPTRRRLLGVAAATLASAGAARAQGQFKLGVVAFQMSSETHARVANTVEAEAKKRGSKSVVRSSWSSIHVFTFSETRVSCWISAETAALNTQLLGVFCCPYANADKNNHKNCKFFCMTLI